MVIVQHEKGVNAMQAVELVEVGDDIGLVLTQAHCKSLGVGLGDELHVTPTPRGFSLHSNRTDTKLVFEKALDHPIALTAGAN